MIVKITVKGGTGTLHVIQGNPREEGNISVADMHKVIEAEHFLRKLTGLEFHISAEVSIPEWIQLQKEEWEKYAGDEVDSETKGAKSK